MKKKVFSVRPQPTSVLSGANHFTPKKMIWSLFLGCLSRENSGQLTLIARNSKEIK